ncbi:Flp pilus assembly protein TadB [Tritonibacter multivorans]|uniref:Flp pilus assembly protein TadB n=1 Tax=Tritonibacter multivorans TaxID=928856 RepID=A0A0P1G1D2_9RHOB|nr:type II secretion system F family protein [Tritonibacter multivorans]MDA7419477.1 type II secretion system F family protein [Tritonibacter multivorans]CUH75542.1 Flp pilus assembly protein TadB [Tritonibacter multivorans]SFC65684.1 type II secretion system protein F (GspF) [Tritonibacter multivorans]
MNPVTFIHDLLVSQLGEFGPLMVVGFLGLVLIVLAVPLLLNQPEDPLKKLQRQVQDETRPKSTQARLRNTDRNEQLQKFASFLEPQDAEELSAMELKLRQAGYRSRDAVRVFHFAQFALGLIGLVAGLAFVYVLNAGYEFTTQQIIIRILGPGGAGYMLPKYWVTRRVTERRGKIADAFPDSLDMMLVCVEAGQSLDQAIVRVAAELRTSFPELAEEYQIVAQELKAGKDKDRVLRDMGTRCGVQDISSFVTVMIQSSTFGTSIAEALRVYAGEMRDKRVMRAEEAANKLPVKMTLATMGLTVPPLLIILVGPSAEVISKLGDM